MQTDTYVANPFAMMLDPQAVLRAIDQSERLARLSSQVFRPLDKPLLPTASDLQAFDDAIDLDAALEDWAGILI